MKEKIKTVGFSLLVGLLVARIIAWLAEEYIWPCHGFGPYPSCEDGKIALVGFASFIIFYYLWYRLITKKK